MTMAAPLPTAKDVIAIIENLIATQGTRAFKQKGRVQLYSGPQGIIALALAHIENNHARATEQSKRLGTKMIDHTKVGKKLERYDGKKNIYQFFNAAYFASHGRDSKEAFQQADDVMRFASRAFVKASFGQVATAVCGAATNRIFFEIELPELMSNGRIETINGIEADRVRGIYHTKGSYAAFHKICQAEIAMAYQHAKGENTKKAWDDYTERTQLFMQERKLKIEADNLRAATTHITAIHASLDPTVPATAPIVKKAHGAGLH